MRKACLLPLSILIVFHFTATAQTGNTGIGTTDPQAKLHVNGDLRLQQGVSVNKFSTDSLFSSNSHSVIPTEKAIKDYVKTGLWMGVDSSALSDNVLVAKGFATQLLANPMSVALKDNYAYIVSYNTSAITSVDISDHNKPTSKYSVSGPAISNPVDIKIRGDYAYVISETNNRLTVCDIAFGGVALLGFNSTGLNMPRKLVINGNFAYVSNSLSSTIQIFDISNPTLIVPRGSIASFASDFQVQGNFAYIVNNNNNSLTIYDISNPNTPVLRGSTTNGLIGTGGVFVKDGFAYVSSTVANVIRVFNVTNPDNITSVSTSTNDFTMPKYLEGSGNYLFVTDANGTAIGVYDISNPSAIVWKGSNSTNLNGVQRFVLSGETVFAASYNNNRLCVFELDRSRNISLGSGGFQSTASQWVNVGKDIYRGNGYVGIGVSQPTANLHVEGKTVLIGQVGINITTPLQAFNVGGNSYFGGSVGIGTAQPTSTLDVQGTGNFSGNLGLGTYNQYAKQTFSNDLGNKIALYGSSMNSQYGIGLQSGLLQLFTDVASASVAIGYGSSTAFTERIRFNNNGYDGMVMNGRIVLRNGTSDPNGGAGVWVTDPGNTTLMGFTGAYNNNTMGFFSNATGWGFTYNTSNGRVGIGNTNPNAKLSFAAALEKKITLYPGTTGDAGISVSGNDTRLYTDNVNARVSFGYDDYVAGFISRAYVPASGAVALVVSGQINANGTVYNSDARYKKNINTLGNSLEKVLQLRGVSYEMKKTEFPDKQFADGLQVGLIAQEVEAIVPEVVTTNADGYKSVDYAKLVPVLIEALKSQQQQRQEDLKRIEKLEELLKQLADKK